MVYIGTGQALHILNIHKEQLYKLTCAGLVTDHKPIGARNWRFDAGEIASVLAWRQLILPASEKAIIVHLGPLRPANLGDTRLVVGYHSTATSNYSAQDLELAWIGNWPISDDEAAAAIGKLLLGDVAGWIPPGLGRRIIGYVRLPDRSLRFQVIPLTSSEIKKYTKKRVKALPGQIWQHA